MALLAWIDGDRLTYAGGAMVTLPARERDAFWERVEELKTSRPSVDTDKRLKEGSWTEPLIRLEVKHLKREEMLRHATVERISSFGRRRIAPARPSREPSYAKPDISLEAVRTYYREIAPMMLPWVRDRPLNLFRCEKGRCFFQRNETHPHTQASFASPIRKLAVAQKNGKTENYLFIDDEAGLLACADLDAVEFHGWGSRVEDIERPDRIAFDLDPGEGVDFEAVKAAALQLRTSLSAIDLDCWPLLTGGKGIHVAVPFRPEQDWEGVRGFARGFCAAIADADPERYTIALPKTERRGRIFLDYLRNQRTATAILPWSARARPGLPVAAPVTWSELSGIKAANVYSVGDVQGLLRRARSRALAAWGRSEQLLPIWR